MSENIGQVMNTVQDTGKVSIAICACLVTLSLLNWLLLFFGLMYLNRFISFSSKKIDIHVENNRPIESKIYFKNDYVQASKEPGNLNSNDQVN